HPGPVAARQTLSQRGRKPEARARGWFVPRWRFGLFLYRPRAEVAQRYPLPARMTNSASGGDLVPLHRQLQDVERRAVAHRLAHQRQRDVVHRDARRRLALVAAVVGVAVETDRHAVAVERLLEAAGAEEGEDRRRLAFDGRLDGGVVQ